MTTELIGALYTRTSHETDDAFSISSQVKLCLTGSASNSIKIPEEYIFREDYTGTVIDRPELNKVRRLMADHKIDVLVIYDIDRLARKKYISEYLLEEEIFGNGVKLFVARKNTFVRNNLSDRILFGIEGNSAQEERDKIIDRTKRGRREKLEGSDGTPGAWLGQSPSDLFGYMKIGKKRKTQLVIVDAEAAVVKLIFDLYVIERWNVAKIVEYLDAQGIKTPSDTKGKHPWLVRKTWHTSIVYRIIKNTAYTGVFYGFQTERINGKSTRRPPEEWIRLDFPELKIVEPEVFEKAQELLAHGRSVNAPKWNHEYLLVRTLRCVCNYATRAKSSTKTEKYGTRTYYYYVCNGKDEHAITDCAMPNIRGDMLDAKVWERLEELLKDPEQQLLGLRRAQELQREQNKEALIDMEQIEQKRTRFLQELDELYQDYKDRVIRKEIYLKRKEPIEERLRAVEAVQQEYQAKLSQEVMTDQDIKAIAGELRQLKTMLEQLGTLEYTHKRNLIELMRVTGQFKIENGEIILALSIHEWAFDQIQLGLVPQSS